MYLSNAKGVIMSKKACKRGHHPVRPGRDEILINKLRSVCIKEPEEEKYERLKGISNEHPPFFGEPVRIIQGKEFGPKL